MLFLFDCEAVDDRLSLRKLLLVVFDIMQQAVMTSRKGKVSRDEVQACFQDWMSSRYTGSEE
jgi:hypothetical protein